MDDSPTASRRSYIPRPSRIPRAAPAPRPSASRDSLRDSTSELSNPRLRAARSRDQLSTTPSRDRSNLGGQSRQTPSKTSPGLRSNNDGPFKKPLLKSSANQQNQTQPRDIQATNSLIGLPQELQNEDVTAEYDEPSRKPRLSLSERTMETLSQLPSSPAPRSGRSSFFTVDSPMRPPSRTANGSRPGSSYQSDNSMRPPSRTTSSRPGSAAEHRSQAPKINYRASMSNFKPLILSSTTSTPSKRPNTSRSLKTPKSTASLRSIATSSRLQSPGAPPEKSPSEQTGKVKSGNTAFQSKPLKTRASVSSFARKPSIQDLDAEAEKAKVELLTKKRSPTFSNASSEDASIISRTSKDSFPSSISSVEEKTSTPRKSSAALREQIAKAKAAKRAENARIASGSQEFDITEESAIIPSDTFDFGLAQDPFNQRRNGNDAKGLLRKRIDAARKDGRLNIAAMGLKEIPAEVMNMYNLESIGGQGSDWAESVDLNRFIAADNEIETLGEDVFPDVDPQNLQDDEESVGNQFGGLETLDLHGNLLRDLPVGLRRLQLLSTLNLSNNKLENDSFDIISQLPALRDLKIGNNALSGELNPSIAKLQTLEVLDLQRNSLSALPDSIIELTRLRVLNIVGNTITSLPAEALRALPLIELIAAKNNLQGTLFPGENLEFPQLQILDVTANSLTSLSSGELQLPALHQLNCSANRLTHLPDLTSWKSLLTITAEDNCIESLPTGFISLSKLKTVDLTGNNIKVLDEKIGQMDNLDILRISGNPLRDRKFSSMSTEDLKRNLRARLTPEIPETNPDDSDGDLPFSTPPSGRPNSGGWHIKLGGILDVSNTDSHTLNPVIVSQIAAGNEIRDLQLHHNTFKEIPSSIAFFADNLVSLSLAHNELSSDTFLKDELVLSILKELNLSSNAIDSLTPLTQHLKAPKLEKLDISFNRLVYLPPLRPTFPSLTSILASHNTIRELLPDSIKGLKVVDCSSNELASLNPRIGLLGGPGGLEFLDVKGNRFRVPKYTVLEKGTEATLSWLRDRIPVGELPVVETSPDDVD